MVVQDSVTSVAVHAHDIVAGSVDGTVRRFDIRMGRMYRDDVHHAVTSIALSHDGQCVLAACLDSKLRYGMVLKVHSPDRADRNKASGDDTFCPLELSLP